MKRCLSCQGSGKLMGNGMIMISCENCNGTGNATIINDEIGYLNLKNTESYKTAKENLIAEHPTLSDSAAERLLDDAIEKEKPKRGRPKKVIEIIL